MKQLHLFLFLPFFAAGQQPQQYSIGGDARVGFISTGAGASIQVTQIFGKSPEYAELKKIMDKYEADIAKKAATCEKMAKDNLPAEYRDGCRSELVMLNAMRDSVAKIEKRFREDVIRLAETFSVLKINSERLRLAKQFFEEGKIREADQVLNAKDMKNEGDALLEKKERAQKALLETDSLLRVKADEFALKGRLKATDYADSVRYDSVVVYFNLARRYAEAVENLLSFARLLSRDNQTPRALFFAEKALAIARPGAEEAGACQLMGDLLTDLQKMADGEKMYLRSLEIYAQLAKTDSTKYQAELAAAYLSLGNFYGLVQRMPESEKLQSQSLGIYQKLAADSPAKFEPGVASACSNLGYLCYKLNKMPEAEQLYLKSLELLERLAAGDRARFGPNLATICIRLGILYQHLNREADSEKMYQRGVATLERAAMDNPAQFDPQLATACMNFCLFYNTFQRLEEAERMGLRAVAIYERMAKSNPAQFEPELAEACMSLGTSYCMAQKFPEGEKMYVRSLQTLEILAKTDPMQFEPSVAGAAMNLANLYYNIGKYPESEARHLQSVRLCEKLVKQDSAQFEPQLAQALMNFANLQVLVKKLAEGEKAYLRALGIFERLAKNNPEQFGQSLAECLANLSSFNIEAKKYPEAAQAGLRALSVDGSLNIARAFVGHAYLLQNDWPRAKAMYEAHLAAEPDPAGAKALLLQDLEGYEAGGKTCSEMGKARAWLKGQ